MIEAIDKTATENGTNINRAFLMAMQGFQAQTTVFNSDGSITETNGLGTNKNNNFNADGTLTEILLVKNQ